MGKILRQVLPILLIALALFVVLVAITRGQSATGGPYTLEKSIVAGGGREKAAEPVGENGTAGQAVAGHRSQGGQYVVYSGFWTPDALAPTAAGVSISGRVTVDGTQGIRNIRLELLSADGTVRRAVTGPFGYYSFTDVPVGETYILTVRSKRFVFDEPTRLISLLDHLADVNFDGRMMS